MQGIRPHVALMFALAVVVLPLAACFDRETTIFAPSQTNNQTINPTPAPAPSPSVSPGPTAGILIDRLTVTFFPDGPGAGTKILRVGEKNAITATPRDPQNNDPCKTVPNCGVYGQEDIRWELGDGATADTSGVVQVTPAGSELYNRDVKALRPGKATVFAIFNGAASGRRDVRGQLDITVTF